MSAEANRVLILTYRMAKGFGVDVVVANLMRQLTERGYPTAIGCIDTDGFYAKSAVFPVSGSIKSAFTLIKAVRPSAVMIHTSPFFELLPELKAQLAMQVWGRDIKWIVWEHGDPTPSLFGLDCERREAEKSFKQQRVYPEADALVVISDFIASDIQYHLPQPAKTKIYNGADHTHDRGQKTIFDLGIHGQPLRIGVLSRIGRGENFYKGTERFHRLIEHLRARGIAVQGSFMGGGSTEDAKHLIAQGYEVHLNSSDQEKWDFLRGLDVFVSCSHWEGFNLPLVEAQAIGTVSMAFASGAHREVCPFVFETEDQMATHIEAYSQDRNLLLADSVRAYRDVREKFIWARLGEQSANLLVSLGLAPVVEGVIEQVSISGIDRTRLTFGRIKHFLMLFGFWGVARRVVKRLIRRLSSWTIE